jgi:hypothetical protein
MDPKNYLIDISFINETKAFPNIAPFFEIEINKTVIDLKSNNKKTLEYLLPEIIDKNKGDTVSIEFIGMPKFMFYDSEKNILVVEKKKVDKQGKFMVTAVLTD